ncbi:hypothetical protein P3TCK_20960 [Photobacterium profundum 3TCK]|uniref:Uncharacterized protein n=1 Tax=Photobacterium profundum 3TCK TaxID=314280 RepID=Q1Z8W4_9GAMM|nr:hypothetical protein P3TCK_20960 [Photobacterium profundum 3TCK]
MKAIQAMRGNHRARRLLVEGAHSYLHPAKISAEMQ